MSCDADDYEPVLAAAFAHFQDTLADSFVTMDRRIRHWNQVNAQPAFFFRHIGDTDEVDPDGLSITTLECEAWIYTKVGTDPTAVPDTALTDLVKAVRRSLAPDAGYGDPRFTLGGLVYRCRIEGRSDYSPGDQAGQALARVPIRITIP